MGHFRALLFALVAAFSIGSSGCVIILKVEPVKPKTETVKPKNGPIDLDEQKRTAYHEAGHAIAAATLFGVERFKEMFVTDNLSGSRLYGQVDMHGSAESPDAEVYQNYAVMYHAGRAADVLINGKATAGARSDLRYAMDVLKNKHYRYGLGRTVCVYEDEEAPVELKADVVAEIDKVHKRAEALVAANKSTIVALADYIMRFPIIKGKRTMTDVEFRAFMKGRVLIDPDKPKAAAR